MHYDIIVNGEGRGYSGDIEASAIGVATPEGYEIIARDDVLLFRREGFAFGPDGTLNVARNPFDYQSALNEGEDESNRQYHILTLKP